MYISCMKLYKYLLIQYESTGQGISKFFVNLLLKHVSDIFIVIKRAGSIKFS